MKTARRPALPAIANATVGPPASGEAPPRAAAPARFRAWHRAVRGLFVVLALSWAGAVLANGASSMQNVNPGGGVAADGSDGLRWLLGSNSQFQVYLGGSGQVYNPPSTPMSGSLFNSVYLRVDRGTDDTTRLYNNSNYGPQVGLHANAISPFTQVSQSAVSGSGTAVSPWQVTTVLRPSDPADSGITVTVVDRYINPQSWLTRRVTLSGLPTSGAAIKFYQHVDTYLQGGDRGQGFARTSAWNTTGVPDVVGVIKGAQFQALWYEPSSGTPHWDRYSSELFTYPIFQMCRGVSVFNADPCTTGSGDLSNTINPDAAQDHGMAAQWNVPTGASSFTVEYRITFAMNPVDLTKAFAPDTIAAGGISTLTFDLGNRSTNAVDSIAFTDTLPAQVQVASVPNIRTNCPAGGPLTASLPSGMTVNAAAGSNVIQVAGGRVDGGPAAGELKCQVAVDVTSSVVGVHHNTNASIGGTNNLANLVGDETLTVLAQPDFGTCDTRLFLTMGTGSSNTTLYDINTSNNPFTYPMIGQGGHRYNATGFNPVDNYLYAMRYNAPSNDLLRVGSDGSTQNLGPVTGLPLLYYNSGAMSPSGVYYVRGTSSGNGDSNMLYAINIAAMTATQITLSNPIATSDMAFVADTLYTMSDAGQLYAINVSTGTVTAIGPLWGGEPILGAQFGGPNGLFGSANNGMGFYRIDLLTGRRTLISGAPGSSVNDGANCPTAPVAFPADLSVTKTNTPEQGPGDLADDTYLLGETRSYTVVVTNQGPFGVQNATVSDPVPAGIDPATVGWTCSSTSGGAECGAATGSGALNDTGLDLPSGAVATYLVTMTVPADFTGDLVNVATITPPASSVDTVPSNNTATDTDASSPLLTIRKISLGGVDSFGFTGTNGVAAQTLTTTVSGTPVAGARQALAAASVSTTITEGTLPSAYRLTGIDCTGLGAGGTATPDLPNGTVVLDAAATAPGADIECTFTNTLQQADIQVVKTASPNPVVSGDVVTYQIVVSNNGPLEVGDVVLTDVPEAGQDCTTPGTTATCSASGGASCPSPTVPVADLLGSGVTIPSLPVGGQVAFGLQCTVTASGH